MKIEKWETPNVPTGELERVFKLAEKIRASQNAPAVSVNHFLWALIFTDREYRAEDMAKLFKELGEEWRKSLA